MSESNRSTSRFSDRVADYVRYRPGYPTAMVDVVTSECELSPSSSVADIGSGTGISTDLFLRLGCHVFAVEPNDAMRAAAEEQFAGQPNFHSIAGSAEATGLPPESQDCIVAGQAFHWFANDAARSEFQRILKPHGFVVLFWNERLTTGARFLEEYEQLLVDFATDYTQVNHVQTTIETIEAFLKSKCKTWEFENSQLFDYDGLKGRLLSCSYAPKSGPKLEPMLDALRDTFERNSVEGRVSFDYTTKLYIGRLG